MPSLIVALKAPLSWLARAATQPSKIPPTAPKMYVNTFGRACSTVFGDQHPIFPAAVLPYYLDMVGWMGRKGDPNTTIYENNAKMVPWYVEDVFS